MKKILITGAAGFIGSNLIRVLLKKTDYQICGIDNFDNFYPRIIKEKNLEEFIPHPNFQFHEGDIRNISFLNSLAEKFDFIIHLAAKAGVRPSILNPVECQEVNVMGTLNLLEYARTNSINKFIFASSSSVYGVNTNIPWKETENLLPISPYASSKLSCEMLGHVYSKLYGIQFIALRFFTVHGPGQRPDLAIHKFFDLIVKQKPIPFYGNGDTFRDYTYIDDIIGGIIGAFSYDKTEFEIFNLGNNQTISLKELVNNIEDITGIKAVINYLPEQLGDVPRTFANIKKAKEKLNYNPHTSLEHGLKEFYHWYQSIHVYPHI